ncbi:MAG: hypothetical protein HOM80_08080 [Bacteroidetes bacterium]|nr:hypothetical protein [Bacteroidota bacterium]
MVTGWEEMDDDEVKDIVEEAIEEAGKNIKSAKNDLSSKKVKDVMAEALGDTEKKVKDEQLESQKPKNKKQL